MTTSAQVSATSRNALVLIAAVVGCAALYWLKDILTPLAMAMFVVVMIDSFVRVLKRRLPSLPDAANLGLAIVGSLILFGLSIYIIAANSAGFIDSMTGYVPKLNSLIANVSAMLPVPAQGPPPTIETLIKQANLTQYFDQAATALKVVGSNVLSGTVYLLLVLIYVGFLLASRRGFERKLVKLFPGRERRHDAMQVFVRVRDGVESYLWIQTVTGIMIAVASWAVMAAFHLDNAFFWAFLIFLLSYIPIIGAAVGIAFPPLFAILQFGEFWQAIVLLGVLYAINFIVGNVVLPKMQGDSMNIDPVAVLLSLAFWGALWGLPGMFLSTPLTVMVMIVLAQFQGSLWIAVLISESGDPNQIKDPPGLSDTPEETAAREAGAGARKAARRRGPSGNTSS
ncbi:MAG: AI-2E family transporter [Caulobacteraceae bacterium]